jgi:hypothetical protein
MRSPRAILTLAAVVVVVAGCGGARPVSGPTVAGTVNRAGTVRGPEAARATAQTEFGLLAGGDYGGAWDLWTEAAQGTINRSAFVTLGSTCPRGVPATFAGQTVVDDDTVTVDWRRGDLSGTARLVYENGAWRYQPDQSTMDGYRQGRC